MISKWKYNYTDEEKGMALTIQNLKQEIDKLVDTNEDINREFSQYKYESKKEIERLNSIINNDFSKICREKMIDKLSANEMILLQEKEIERLNNIINELEKWLDTIPNYFMDSRSNNNGVYIQKGMKQQIDMTKQKIKELKGSNETIPPEVIGTNGENGGLFDYGDR